MPANLAAHMRTQLTVLVTGAGAPGTRGTLYALRSNGTGTHPRIVGADLRPDVVGRYLCDSFCTLPPPEHAEYLSALIEAARRESVKAVLPQTTREMAAIAAAREELEQHGIRAVVSPAAAIEAANNKFTVLNTFQQLGLPYPEYRLARCEPELVERVHELGYPERAVVVKPPVSNGMRGFRILRQNAWNAARFLAEKPTGVDISLTDLLAILRTGETWPELVVTEYLPGPEYTVDAFIGAGSCIAIPRLRAEIRSGISFVTRCELRSDLMDYSLRAARELGLRFAFGFQYKLDAGGVPKVLECNPRVQGTMVASVFAGANIIWMSVCEALGDPQAADSGRLRPTRFYRYWGGVGVTDDETFDI